MFPIIGKIKATALFYSDKYHLPQLSVGQKHHVDY